MKLYKFAFAPFAFLAVACGGGGSDIDLDGKTPAEQAETVANAICEEETGCPALTLDIVQEGKTITCEVIPDEEAQTLDECVADVEEGALEIFENCELTDAEIATIEDCINEGVDCLTEADYEAACDAIEAGEEPEEQELSAACQEMEAIIEGCQTPA